MESSSLELVAKNKATSPGLVFKGYKTGLTLIIPESGALEDYLDELRQRLHDSRDFFRGAHVSFQIGNRILQEAERTVLNTIVSDFGLIPHDFVTTPKSARTPAKGSDRQDFFIETITIKKTVRSGQRIEFEGNLVIIGDVNPGAEVVASGDIIVIGKLRGTAHAGAKGDPSAKVIALELQPLQLRIAGVITRAPEQGKKPKSPGAEVAQIKNDLIVVEPVMVH